MRSCGVVVAMAALAVFPSVLRGQSSVSAQATVEIPAVQEVAGVSVERGVVYVSVRSNVDYLLLLEWTDTDGGVVARVRRRSNRGLHAHRVSVPVGAPRDLNITVARTW